uniref:Ig-like domain-containing protein n=1 Tax=Periophthalmus magnuspinnatus TaxID=409849 RepID=A0A3B3ZDZ4_9GOBI
EVVMGMLPVSSTLHPFHFTLKIFHPSLCNFCSEPQDLIGLSPPIVARIGDDVILPCFFQPPRDAEALTLEWTRPDLQPRFVFVWRSYEELKDLKHSQFDGRAFLFQDELKHGNISLKLTNVKPKDSGVYRCFIPALEKETSVKLIVGEFVQKTILNLCASRIF